MPPETRARRGAAPGGSGFPGWFWLASLGPVLAVLGVLALEKPFAVDEFLYLHWGAMAARGSFAGVDYFASHFPLLQLVLAPLFRLFADSCVEPMFAARGVALATFLITVSCASRLLARRELRAPGAVLLLSLYALVQSAVEVRPDLLSLALFTGGAVLYLGRDGRLAAMGAGALFGLSILASEKALVHGLAFAACLAFALWRSDGRAARAAEWRRIVCAASAVLAVLAVGLVALWRGDRFQQARLWLEFLREHESAYPAESHSRLRRAGRLLLDAPLYVLAPLGAGLLWRRVRASLGARGALREARRDLFVLAAGCAGLLSVGLQRAPYRYSWLPFLLFGGLWVVEALAWLATWVRSRLPRLSERHWRRLVELGVLLVVGLQLGRSMLLLGRGVNAGQLAGVARICRLTAPDDCVYDNSAIAFARPHADDYFVWTDAWMRFEKRQELAQRIPRSIRARGCAVYVRDVRAGELPRSLKEFLGTHYLPVGGDLFLWGARYPAGDGTVRFEAVAPGEYSLWPASARLASGERRIRLPAGEHELAVSAPEEFAILWLPRDGEPLAPLASADDPAAGGPFSVR